MSNKLRRVVAMLVLIAIVATTTIIIAYGAENETQQLNIESNMEVETITETATEPETTVPEVIVIETETVTPMPTFDKKVAKCFVNARATTDMSDGSDIITLPRGTEVNVLGTDEGWARVYINGEERYIWAENLMTPEAWASYSEVPYSDQVPLSEDLQRYLWNECRDTGTDYCFALAIMDIETGGTFRPDIISRTNDYGLFQCNGCWKSTFKKLGLIQNDMRDLLNPYNSIHAGLYLLSQYQAEFGVAEPAAVKYNRGHASSGSSTPYSRKAMQNYAKWKSIIGDIS